MVVIMMYLFFIEYKYQQQQQNVDEIDYRKATFCFSLISAF